MPKDYFCNKLLDNGDICGERDPTKFQIGRYSSCKSCRSSFVLKHNKTKNTDKKEEKINKIDPDVNLRWLIEDVIKTKPLVKGQTIEELLNFFDNEMTINLTKQEQQNRRFIEIFIQHEKDMTELLNKIRELENKTKELKNEIHELKKINV